MEGTPLRNPRYALLSAKMEKTRNERKTHINCPPHPVHKHFPTVLSQILLTGEHALFITHLGEGSSPNLTSATHLKHKEDKIILVAHPVMLI